MSASGRPNRAPRLPISGRYDELVPAPLRIAFLGCGFITRVHSGHLRALRGTISTAFASRDRLRSEQYCRQFGGVATYADYSAAIASPEVDAVVVAVPPRFHLDLTMQALGAGKHVLVEKPAFLCAADYERVIRERERVNQPNTCGACAEEPERSDSADHRRRTDRAWP